MSELSSLPVWSLGERMAKARENAGLSRQQMADELRVSERTIRNYEGEVTRIGRDTVMAYAAITGVPVWWLEAADEVEAGFRSRWFSGDHPPELDGQLSLPVAA